MLPKNTSNEDVGVVAGCVGSWTPLARELLTVVLLSLASHASLCFPSDRGVCTEVPTYSCFHPPSAQFGGGGDWNDNDRSKFEPSCLGLDDGYIPCVNGIDKSMQR